LASLVSIGTTDQSWRRSALERARDFSSKGPALTSTGREAGSVGGNLVGRAARSRCCAALLTTFVLTSCVVGGGLFLASAPASALSQRGHVFSFSFGGPGTRAGLFLEPSAVAVDDATGDVYVADRGNDRVEVFEPELNAEGELAGERFVSQFSVPYPEGIAVDNSTGGPSSGDVYVLGTTAEEAKELHEAPPASGAHATLVYKFDAEGKAIATLSTYRSPEVQGEVNACEEEGKTATECEEAHEGEAFGAVDGIAVDTGGKLFVYGETRVIDTFNDAEKNEGESNSQATAEAHPGFAVDSEGDFYAGATFENPADPAAFAEVERHREEDQADGLIESEANFAVVAKLEHETASVLNPGLDLEDSTAVAVNPASVGSNDVNELNDAYVTNLTFPGGQEATTVAAFAPDGSLIQRFGVPGLKEGDGIAVDASTGTVFVADTVSDRIDAFELEPPGPPQVDGLSEVPSPLELQAPVNPDGSDTHYHFEYGSSSCTVPSACTATPEVDVGAGFGDQQASVLLPGLAAGLYHYRVSARSALGTAHSAEQTFSISAPTDGLLDNRAWEMVSPPNKDGAEPVGITAVGGLVQASEDGDAIGYTADGPIPADQQPEGSRSPEEAEILSSRSPQGWLTRDLATPNEKGSGANTNGAQEYQFFSTSLALALVQPFFQLEKSDAFERPPLSPPLSPKEEGHQQKTIYLRDDAPLAPDAAEAASFETAKHNGELMQPINPGYLALVDEANAPGGEEFGGGEEAGLEFLGATPDLSHVLFASKKAAPGLYEWGPSRSPQLVSVLPNGVPAGNRPNQLRLATISARHEISNDGTRVFWRGEEAGVLHLFVRDTARQETLQLDAVRGGSGVGKETPVFQTASADGSKVFFTDEQRLTAGSKASKGEPDLYVFELGAPGSPLSGSLTDLTPEGIGGEAADVLANQESERGAGGVLGAGEDGSDVYFVANGALVRGASRGDCAVAAEPEPPPPPGTTCNLYVSHYNGTDWDSPRLVAMLSAEDAPDWQAIESTTDLAAETSRVSPSGEYLAFMSDRSLTGYDNADATPAGEAEGAHDEETYLYNASSERLVCASCNPSGARPKGVFDEGAGPNNTDGIGLLVDRLETWSSRFSPISDHWLAGSVPGWTGVGIEHSFYQSRYLTDNGRLFFTSPDHLVPSATSDKEKVFEYEPDGLGSCHSEAGCVGLVSSGNSEHESAFLDASASGNDVFFLTQARLAPQDVDTNFDIYDAHVCEASSPCPPAPSAAPAPCQETPESPCKGSPPSTPVFAAPGSSGALGASNLAQSPASPAVSPKAQLKPPTRAEKLTKALKTCRRKKPIKKRRACEAQARRHYGPKHHAKARSRAAQRRRG
jgi:DNA-binding beta-propeller fold protein YncE